MDRLIKIEVKLNILEYFKVLFALKCHKALINKKRIYSWCWILLPNWRWYLIEYKNEEFKNRYSAPKLKPKNERLILWKLNGFKYKLKSIIAWSKS